jgi:hypothetical protein
MSSPHAASPGEEHDSSHDAEALSWGDESDATYVDAPQNAVISSKVKPRRERPHDSDASGSLVGMGVFGGLYLLYTVAWLISGTLLPVSVGSPVADAFAEVLRVVAIMAPALWFVGTLWLGQRNSTRSRFIWLIIGVLVLIPWPFIMTRSF